MFSPPCLVGGMRTHLTGDLSWMLTMHWRSKAPGFLRGYLWPNGKQRSACSLGNIHCSHRKQVEVWGPAGSLTFLISQHFLFMTALDLLVLTQKSFVQQMSKTSSFIDLSPTPTVQVATNNNDSFTYKRSWHAESVGWVKWQTCWRHSVECYSQLILWAQKQVSIWRQDQLLKCSKWVPIIFSVKHISFCSAGRLTYCVTGRSSFV